jgi:hypothetical protein
MQSTGTIEPVASGIWGSKHNYLTYITYRMDKSIEDFD